MARAAVATALTCQEATMQDRPHQLAARRAARDERRDDRQQVGAAVREDRAHTQTQTQDDRRTR